MNEPVDLQSMDEAQMRQMLQHLMSELKCISHAADHCQDCAEACKRCASLCRDMIA